MIDGPFRQVLDILIAHSPDYSNYHEVILYSVECHS